MSPEVTPESVRGASFRTVLRGADQSEVERFLNEIADSLEELKKDRDRLATRLGEFADRDLRTEFENVGREITTVLEAAREAAETMRERASADAARWRSESMAESEQVRKEARNDAEAMRRDAWATGSELLSQTVAEANRIRESAERDAITIAGEAEREAHRLVSGARREAEDVHRSATMDGEKITAEAEKSRDLMLEQARKQAEASQERTRALEQRREELMEELEGVRAALHQMEGTLEAKREDLNLSKTRETSVKVIPGNRPADTVPKPAMTWQPGETVRIIRGEGPEYTGELDEPEPEPDVTETMRAEPREPEPRPSKPVKGFGTRQIKETPPPRPPPAPQPAVEPAAPEPEVAETDGGEDEVGALFESLRSPEEVPPSSSRPPEPVEKNEGNAPKTQKASTASKIEKREADDLIEERDGVLLPITNRALRGVKKAVTEAQNVALDGLRTDTGWEPDRAAISETLRADLITLWAESYTAGHHRAEALVGAKLKRPATPTTDSPELLGSALVSDLEHGMGDVADGQRELQSAASKVFRTWRTDEAERRVRSLALLGYHRGLVESAGDRSIQWVASGTPCSACRQAAGDPASTPPPVHPGCECTLAL